MKGIYALVLSLFLTLGLAFGQADQDAGGAVQDEPAQEAPVGQDDAAGQEDAAQDQDAAERDDAQDQDAQDDAQQDQDAAAAQPDMAADQSIVQALQGNPEFSMFADALQRAGLTETLEQEGPFTILAPTDQAFQQAGIDLEALSQDQLTTLVRNHIISGMVSADQLSTLAGVVTLLGTEYAVTPEAEQPVAAAEQQEGEVAGGGQADQPAQPDQQDAEEQPGDVAPPEDQAAQQPAAQPGADGAVGASVGDATITHPAIQAGNGVVYGISGLLIPEDLNIQGVEGGGAADQSAAEPAAPDAEEDAAEQGMDEEAVPGMDGEDDGAAMDGAADDADGMGDDN